MLDVISKREFFEWWDAGLISSERGDLKGTQDAWILSMLEGSSGKNLCEVGGGNSRVLKKLAGTNTCTNADKLEGHGAGPKADPMTEHVRLVRAYLGEFDPGLDDGSFDAVFSISVMEHVEHAGIRDCFADCARILKPGGLMLHAIDTYVGDAVYADLGLAAYRVAVESIPEFEWMHPPALVSDEIGFKCSYASNPDWEMAIRNRIAPKLRDARGRQQNISLKLAARKRG